MTWWSGSSGYLMVGIDIYQHGDPNSGSIELEIVYRVKADGYGHNWSNTLHRWGEVSGDVSFSFSSARGGYDEKEIIRERRTYRTEYGSGRHVEFSASIGPIWNGGAPQLTVGWDIPAKSWGNPPTPSNFTAASRADGTVLVTWGMATDPNAPADWLGIDRWDASTAQYRRLANLPASARSWVDKNVPANDQYRWRIHAWRNDGAESGWVENKAGSSNTTAPGDLYSTPGVPKDVKASKITGGAIRVTWVKTTPYRDQWGVEIWDGDTKVGTAPAGATSWTHSSFNPSITHQYRVRQLGPGGLVSPYSETSNSVYVLSVPGTPGGLKPQGSTIPMGEGVLEWIHATQDTTAQTKAQVRLRSRGASDWSTYTVTGDSQQYSVAAFSEGTYEWQVRTWGMYKPNEEAGASPWSAVSSFLIAARPTAGILSPETRIDTSQLVVRWSYYQPSAARQTLARIQVTDVTDNRVVADQVIQGAASSYTVPERAVNGHEYSTSVVVVSDEGLESKPATRKSTVRYAPPEAPKVTAQWDDSTGVVSLGITNPPPKAGKTVAAVSNQVDRSQDDGQTWETIASDLPIDVTVQDWEAPSGGKTLYRVTASSVTPSSESTTVTITAASRQVWISGGPGYRTCVGFKYEPEVTVTPSLLHREVKHFAGRARGVEVTGTAVQRAIAISAVLTDSEYATHVKKLEELAILPAPFLYRDPLGRRIYCSLSSISAPRSVGGIWKVSLELEEVEA